MSARRGWHVEVATREMFIITRMFSFITRRYSI